MPTRTRNHKKTENKHFKITSHIKKFKKEKIDVNKCFML